MTRQSDCLDILANCVRCAFKNEGVYDDFVVYDTVKSAYLRDGLRIVASGGLVHQ